MGKKCTKCHVEKPLGEFRTHKHYGIYTHCKSCESELNREYKASPVGKSRQTLSKSRYTHRQSGASAEDTLTSHEVAMVLNEGACNYCQRDIDYSEATVDHVVTFGRGGANSFSNVVCACKSCNSSKADKPVLLHLIQSCQPYATKKLLERLALRRGVSTEEVYTELVIDAQAYFAEQSAQAVVST